MRKLREWTVVMYGVQTDLSEENLLFGTAFPRPGETLEEVAARAKKQAYRGYERRQRELEQEAEETTGDRPA